MDAQELLETLTARRPAGLTPTADCASAREAKLVCTGPVCRWRCALEVIDELLRLPHTQVSGEETDLLLDLRWQLRQRTEAETVLRLFSDLRRRMEARHYLAFFRLRRWLENHLLAAVRICPAAEARTASVKLDHYCVEAIRRVCLCACLEAGSALLMPRLQFAFRPVAGVASGEVPMASRPECGLT